MSTSSSQPTKVKQGDMDDFLGLVVAILGGSSHLVGGEWLGSPPDLGLWDPFQMAFFWGYHHLRKDPNGADPNYLWYLGWSSKYTVTQPSFLTFKQLLHSLFFEPKMTKSHRWFSAFFGVVLLVYPPSVILRCVFWFKKSTSQSPVNPIQVKLNWIMAADRLTTLRLNETSMNIKSSFGHQN